VFDDRAERVSGTHWPGPVTIVLPRSAAASAWDLGGDPFTVGVRRPRHPLALAVLEETGPLAVTSANRSGEAPATTCDELHSTFGDGVSVYLCEDAALAGAASTVLDLAHGPARILRAGSVSRAALAALLPDEPSLLDSRPS
jgi:L-threonylcarbamoyladenylate synthase